MQELRLVAVSEDGTYLVLATAGRGTRFTLPVDDRLRAAVRGHFSRLGQFEIEVESPLRPKEIQARIRSGETAEEIAESAGIPVERVRWFEGPVLQEREYMAQQAQRVAVRRQGESSLGPPLGEMVEERLNRGGVDLEDVEWDSWKCEDSTWRVRLSFFDDGRPHAAEWIFDPRRRHLSPLDEVAARLSSLEWDASANDTVTPLVPRRPAMKVVQDDGEPRREYIVERGRMVDPRQASAEAPATIPRPADTDRRALERETTYETAEHDTGAGEYDSARGESSTRDTAERVAAERQTARRDATSRQAAQRKAAARGSAQRVAITHETAEHDATTRDTFTGETALHDATKDDTRGTAERDTSARDAATREAAEQEAAKLEAAKQEAAEREAAEREAAEKDAAKREAAEKEAAEKEAAQRETAEREAAELAAAERAAAAQREAEENEAAERKAAQREAAERTAAAEREAAALREAEEREMAELEAAERAEEERESAERARDAAERKADAERKSAAKPAPPKPRPPRREQRPKTGSKVPEPAPEVAEEQVAEEQVAEEQVAEEQVAEEQVAAAAGGEVPVPAQQRTPASRNRRKSKGKRASVPSWDEIMFGARRPD